MKENNKVKLFIGIRLSPELTDYLDSVIRKNLSSPHDNIKWVPKDNLHLSVKFLGDTLEADLPDIEQALAVIALKSKPFDMDITELGTFGWKRRPKIIFAAVKENPVLTDLKKAIEEEFGKIGFEIESRPFKPHITLARTKDSSNLFKVKNLMEGDFKFKPQSMTVTKIHLMKSTPTEGPPVYKNLKSLALSH